jgi:hypothetical protein
LRDLLSSIRSSLVDHFTVVSLHLSLSTLQFSAYDDQLFRTALLPHLTDPFSPIPQILRTLLLRRIQSRAYHLLIQIVLLFSNILSIIYHLYSSFQPRRLPIPIRVVVAPLCAPLFSSTSRIDFPLDTLHLLSDTVPMPLALHSQITRSDFDPDFVATLLSRNPSQSDVVDIILDTGCTFSITHDKRDFVIYHDGSNTNSMVQTVNGPTPLTGSGIVRWTLISENGQFLHLEVPCHYVPSSTIRLLSPQDFCLYKGLDRSKDQFGGNSNYFWMHADLFGTRFQCPIDPRSNLPVALAKLPCHLGGCTSPTSISPTDPPCSSCAGSRFASLSVFDETNQNITSAQKELLLWHSRLGHLGFNHIQRLMHPRVLDPAPSKSLMREPCILPKHASAKTCKPPLCAACQIAKAKRRNAEVSTTSSIVHPHIKHNDLFPGSRISIDQYESSVRGRLATTRGKESFGTKYAGGTIFCDHSSGLIQCFHQASLRASDTVVSKRSFERLAKSCGVKIKAYHGDNGVFKAKEFMEAITSQGQEIRFSGVGAHHQNGVAERAIRNVTEKARSMMQHAHLHWPEESQVDLWPFALDYACWITNHTPNHKHGWMPIELFCGTNIDCQHLRRTRVWGCPGYVLSPTLQDGKKIPKWAPKARRGQFLGFSKDHSSKIGLFRNLQTGSISPQFHVVFDELFTTVTSTDEDDDTWIELFVADREYYGPDEDEEDPDNDDMFPDIDPNWLPVAELPNEPRLIVDDDDIPQETQDNTIAVDTEPELAQDNPVTPTRETQVRFDLPPAPITRNPARTRLPDSGIPPPRVRRPNRKIFGDDWVNHSIQLTPTSRTLIGNIVPALSHDDIFLHSLDWDAPFVDDFRSYESTNILHVDPHDNEIEWFHPFTLAAKASSADTPTLRDIQKLPPQEIDLWYDAMDLELEALRSKDTMIEIKRSDVPQGKQIIKSTWAFRRKRRPNGEIHKLKARFVVRGDLQVLENSEGTYSPVVDWSTVRLLFVLSVARGLKSKTIDFNAAFVQSTLPEPIYLELPPGYTVQGQDKVYKVSKSLYGDVRAAKLWYKHLSDALVSKMGFRKSVIDSCLYYRDGLIFVFYVDDGIIVSHDDRQINAFIDELRACSFDLGVEEDYAGYLGVDIITRTDGTILMSQTGLIERILLDLGLTESTSFKSTPATEVLAPFKSSPPLMDNYNYRSVLGKIMYLSSNTRCELSLANHQCARFSIDPRAPHGIALKRIGRYLLGTRDKGMIIRPTTDLSLNCYADADFAGLFTSSDPDDPKSVKSRSGFVITLSSVPVSWSSKLQTETALSTMESEYISLSQSLRVLLPLRIVLDELATSLNLKHDPHSSIKSTIFEDNQACLSLASSDPPKMTPRSKSIAVKYHWFREHLQPGVIDLVAISSSEQLADIFTKPLSPPAFTYLRKKLLGW